MIGSWDPDEKRVTVVGAGIAGLLLAYFLDRAGYVVTLREAADRAGGLIRTRPTPFGISESAAHSLLATPPVRALFAELNVPLIATREPHPARWITRGDVLRRVPWHAIGPLAWLVLLLRAACVPAREARGYESLEAWGHRHLGRGATEAMLAPFVRGIYGAELAELDAGLAFPAMLPKPGRSLLWHLFMRPRGGQRAMMAPLGGMEALVSGLSLALEQKLGDRFVRGQAVAQLPSEGQIALCVPAAEASRLLKEEAPDLAARLERVRYVPLASVTSFVTLASLDRAPDGVGYLSARPGHPVLGTLFNSASFAGRSANPRMASLTTMIGGGARPEALALGDTELEALVLQDLRAHFGPRTRLEHRVIHRWPRAIPLYDRALGETLESARASWCARPGRVLFGNYTGDVSIRAMIERLSSAV